MKVLHFTIPVPGERNIIVQRDKMPYMYPHLHRHDEMQLTWIIKGEGTLVVENNMHPFRSNEIYCIGANQPHVFKNEPDYFSGDLEVEALTIFFNPNGKLRHLFELAETRQIRSFLHKHRTGFMLPEETVEEISGQISLIEEQGGVEQLISFLDMLRKFSAFTNLKELSGISEMAGFSEHEGIRLGNIYNYILGNYARQITLEDVARQAHMTPQAFCRYFKKRTRHTFVSFLNEVRINEACKKLTDGTFDSISAIAYNCGFNSITNFNRVFKSVVGKSPSEYVEEYFLHTYEAAS
ncbi:helix-turn-helix domain-containing protein [Flavihumibacter stibioxidans]|uniref:AraC family transcriptional regulator n=1 Tax=Flavihumibacter stibioxidans TaxID=1834163 RepID=A0ABR7MA57_9BACT|nr:AraC family transcriptional regulator [Flavihumibacter stibioxidans]MBC6491915.1 AraC family transcriptional regulator [Flavihumibacter stibioxidans]